LFTSQACQIKLSGLSCQDLPAFVGRKRKKEKKKEKGFAQQNTNLRFAGQVFEQFD
jgi:hypothetical protein